MPLEIPRQFNIATHFIDRPAAVHPSKPAILGDPVAVSYEELRVMTNRVGSALRAMGCASGDRVLLVLPDSAEFVAAFFGAAKIGAIAVPVNPMTRHPDYEFFVQDLEPRACILHEMAVQEFSPRRHLVGQCPIVICGNSAVEAGHAGIISWSVFLQKGGDECVAQPTASTDRAFFLYTSGSSGRPKAAIHQHKDMLVTSTSFAQQVLGICPDDVTFSVSKLFFAYGLGNAMYFPLSVGASTVYLPERPRPERVLETVGKYRPSLFFAVPTMYGALLRAAEAGAFADFSSVRIAVSAGEALPAEIFWQFQKRFGLAIVDAIGSTEMLHMFISNRPGEARAETCGLEVPGCEAQIRDEEGKSVATGEIGNLWVKGQSALEGYWKRPEQNQFVKLDGWVATGDKFFRDEEGYFHYCGRRDDMFKVSGMWVAPGEVENALLAHPAVAEAAVVEQKDRAGLSTPIAFVVWKEQVKMAAKIEEVLAFVRARLPSYKCPRGIFVVPELPKTATGKIQRFRLRELNREAG